MSNSKFSDAKHGAAIAVKVVPRARRTELDGLMDDGTLKVRVAAPPVGGAANKALISYLSQVLGIATNQIEIVAGETSQRKLITLVGISPDAVDAVLQGLLPAAKGQAAKRGRQRDGKAPK